MQHEQKQIADRRYIPALRFHWLTGAYDAVLAATTRERTFKRALVAQLGLAPGQRVLDLGAGTGTLTTMIARAEPAAHIVGLDADSDALSRASTKAARAGLENISFRQGFVQQPPFVAEERFDRIVSSLMFHHLERDKKLATLRAARRLLAPGGELHIADFGRPSGSLTWLGFSIVRLLDGFSVTRDHRSGQFAHLVGEAGFSVKQTMRFRTLFGTLYLYRALPQVSSIDDHMR